MSKFYITTSIPYTNAPPHAGSALELIQADAIARYNLAIGKKVFFITGTDEHGEKIEKTAKREGKSPQKFVDEISAKYRELKKTLNLSNSDFIRTTDRKRHWPAVKKVWLKLAEQRDIYKKRYQGLYCVGCEAFLQKRELVAGKCPNHQIEPELVEEENYFFRLSKYAKKVAEILKKDKLKIIPETRKNEITSFIKEGVEDISCSRRKEKLGWAIPVPGDENQVIYVWMEALVNYISVLGYSKNSRKFQTFWPADLHCVGKDIFRFHALFWPAMLLSLGLKLPKSILVHGFISVAGKKMSKSLGNVIDPFELAAKYGTDAVRYYFLREIPTTEDGDFTYERLEERYNAELASGIGNLTSRITALTTGNQWQATKRSVQGELGKVIAKTWQNYHSLFAELKLNEVLKLIWQLVSFCDAFIDRKKPWAIKKDRERILASLLYVLFNISKMLQPFLPETSGKIAKHIGAKSDKSGRFKFRVKKSSPLFPRIQ